MHKLLLTALLTTVAIPALAADLPGKAPVRPAVPFADWSGIYVGGAAGYGWGREKLTNSVGVIDNLFGTGVGRAFDRPVLLQPDFDLGECVIDNCDRLKMRGAIAGGFAGAQKQMGNWVIGLEGSWDWTGMKKSESATTAFLEDVTRFDPRAPIVHTVPGEVVNIPAQTVTVPGQTAPVSVTVGPQGVQVVSVLLGTGAAPGTVIPAGTVFPIIVSNGAAPAGGPPAPSTQVVPLTTNHDITVGAGGNIVLVQGLAGNVTLPSGVVLASAVTTTGGPGTGTAIIAPTPITIPAQTVTANPTSITVGLPREALVRATVTRSVDIDSKLDQIVDIRGKIGLTNIFFGPNVMLYATGGGTVGHFQKTLTLTQTVDATAAGFGTRTNTFTSSTGDTRLGWVVGAGFDWKLTPNVILGALYRHHEFPKSTVAFNDEGGQGRAISFGTSRASVDSVQGRLSVLFPIQ
jgi:opacity protein-like surface antigen